MITEEELKREYENRLAALRKVQANCTHEWGKIEYTPEIQNIPKFEDRYIGSDYMPEFVGYDHKTIDRWSRTCKKCGKIEYTKEQVATQYLPKF